MDVRLVLTLHLDAFNMAQGGGWTTYDKFGKKTGSMALPGFPGGELLPDEAARLLINVFIGATGVQLQLPDDEQA